MISEFAAGAGTLARGFALMGRRPRILLLGAVPPLITSVLFVGLLVALITNLGRLLGWVTGFAGSWTPGLHRSLEVAAGIALIGGSVLIMVLGFSVITLALGAPLYDKISELVDRELGELPEPAPEPLPRLVFRTIGQAAAMLAASLLGALVLFLLGLIPVVGQTVVPVLSACFGGWLLGLELLGAPFERRGLLRIADRRRAVRAHPARTLGFAVPSFLLLAIPFVSVVVFPAATAGATVLARALAPDSAAARTSSPA